MRQSFEKLNYTQIRWHYRKYAYKRKWNDTSVPKHYGITTSQNTNVWTQPVLSQCNDTSVLGTRGHYQKSLNTNVWATSVKTM
jgi:hypothetical protein